MRSEGDQRYWPALDGVRAVGVVAVIAFHLGYFGGGWLGVDVFFVLSGYLITTLLLGEHDRLGRIRLRAFWGRRAKRLLPAVLLVLAFLAVYVKAGGSGVVAPQLRGPSLATLAYVANWQQIIGGHGYFAQFNAPGPLLHTWSLAIEEQYYVIWPPLFLLLLGLTRGARRTLAGVIGTLAVASAVWMGVAAHVFGVNRAYLGTDTRAWELLLGGLVAVLFPPGAARGPGERARWSWVALLAAGGAGVGMVLATGPPAWVWDGGLPGIGVCIAVAMVGALRAPEGALARLLTLRPVRWLGRISYSLYLWHWPVIVLLTGLPPGELLVARVAVMTAAACASYYLVELPLRRADWGSWRRRSLVPVAVTGTALALVAATVTPAGAGTAAVSVPAAPVSVASVPLPLRVWIMGDSVMYDGSLGIAAALQATGQAQVVANTAYGGWGLTTDKAWPGDANRIVAQDHPNVVLGTWSWDDPSAAADPTGYTRRLRGAIGDLLGDGVQLVVLVQFPQGGPSAALVDPAQRQASLVKQTAQQHVWDRAAQAATAAFPGRAAYLTTDALFAPGGRFRVWLPTPSGTYLRARKVDDYHLCPYGASSFGALVVADLAPSLHLVPEAPGWQSGAWSHDPRYNDPPGACPADQPPAGYTGTPVPGVR